MLVDVHAHPADPAFAGDLGECLARAAARGVARVVGVGESVADAHRLVDLATRHPSIAPAAGLYPTRLDPEELDALVAFVRGNRDRLVAVGEIGLDRWAVRETADLERQHAFFLAQVRLAMELDLPVNVHSRSAGHHTIEALREAGARRVLMHAFDGRAGAALEGVRLGYFFSIPPSIVRSRQKQKLVRALPLTCLLLESDSPVLGPVPGERNEPANLTVAMAAIAELKRVSPDEVERVTTENALRLFGERILRRCG